MTEEFKIGVTAGNICFSKEVDSWDIRNNEIPLPGGKNSSDGYSRVLFVGTTGAGKTTIVRQLLGTDPDTERFPSISAAKTTTSDIEIIFSDGDFKCVVTFIPKHIVLKYISECIIAAVITRFERKSEQDVMRRFLEHSEQKFRLSYILGSPSLLNKRIYDDMEDEEEDEDKDKLLHGDCNNISEEERKKLLKNLEYYASIIIKLADKAIEYVSQELNVNDVNKVTKETIAAMHERIEYILPKTSVFKKLVNTIFEDIRNRFDLLEEGIISQGDDGWPIKWIYTTSDRQHFIDIINKFSSNNALHFGRLLTPLVDGIRVRGRFKPLWYGGESIPKIVVMDGQGIGHIARNNISISTSITSRFHLADKIVLVDNAAQPMQSGPYSVLTSISVSGHISKLQLAFTHFDEVRGDNLQGMQARKDHVLGSVDNALHAIGKELGKEYERSLRLLIPNNIFFFGKIQKKLKESSRFTLSEIIRFLNTIEPSTAKEFYVKQIQENSDTGERKKNSYEDIITISEDNIKEDNEILQNDRTNIQYIPTYNVSSFISIINESSQEFHSKWRTILNLEHSYPIAAEHWTRIKALARRLGIFNTDEYDSLKPVADMIIILQKHISKFLADNVVWSPYPPPSILPEHTKIIDNIREEIFNKLHTLARRRILDSHVRDWVSAYEHSGTGSAKTRAYSIANIYDNSFPKPIRNTDNCYIEIEVIINESIKKCGGEVKNR